MELRDKRYNDIRLIFHEEEHKYNDSLGNDYISTTTILHNYAPKFVFLITNSFFRFLDPYSLFFDLLVTS